MASVEETVTLTNLESFIAKQSQLMEKLVNSSAGMKEMSLDGLESMAKSIKSRLKELEYREKTTSRLLARMHALFEWEHRWQGDLPLCNVLIPGIWDANEEHARPLFPKDQGEGRERIEERADPRDQSSRGMLEPTPRGCHGVGLREQHLHRHGGLGGCGGAEPRGGQDLCVFLAMDAPCIRGMPRVLSNPIWKSGGPRDCQS